MSSHGWNIWKGDSFQSFTHHSEWICVQSGWTALGAADEQKGRARFSVGGSGVLIRANDFTSQDIPTKKHDFSVRVVYPTSLDAAVVPKYIAIITRAFDAVGALYPDVTGKPIVHTVLITVGIAGDGHDFETSVYPDPSLHLSLFVHNLDHIRAEELYLHAVAHLYNRYRTDLIAYEDTQAPLRGSDWEELEATWTELAFRSSKEGLLQRVLALSHMYYDIMGNTFSETDLYPFNDKNIFDAVQYKTTIQPDDAQYPDEQFGHYILGPLLLLSIEGRFAVHGSPVHIKDIFTRMHTTHENFFTVLGEYISADEVSQIVKEARGTQLLSADYIQRGAEYYSGLLH